MEYIYIIDAGHGPNTPGKRSPDGTLREYNFNHPTAQKLATKLRRHSNTHVYFAYTAGEDTPLATRVARANSVYAKYSARVKAGTAKVIFISVHANAFGAGGWNNAQGIETFSHAPASANPSSTKLAQAIQKELVAHTGRPSRGVKHMAFYVLKHTHMPAVLLECGFMTNKTENNLLKTDAYREKCAQAAYEGALAYMGIKSTPTTVKPATPPVNVQKPAPTPAPEPEKEAYSMSQTPSPRFAEAVQWAKDNNISDGSDPFRPTERQETLQMLYNLAMYFEQQQPHPDLQASPRFEDALAWAAEKGISDGSAPKVHAPREQVIQMLYADNERKGTL